VVSSIDDLIGIEIYSTKSAGVGGVIKQSIDDFVVEEVLVDGTKANINGSVPSSAIGSTAEKQRCLLCLMVKRNWDTFIAVKNVAKSLGIDQNRVQFAGIKDARAVTAQHVTIRNVTLKDILKVKVKDVEVYPIGFTREMLSLFYLLGNNFTVNIKNFNIAKEIFQVRINKIMEEISILGGVPNFFGHQRFGTARPITHLVGKAIVRGDFEEAAMLYLAKPSMHEHPVSRKARQELESTKDFKLARENFPKQLRFERMMLNYLAKYPDDFVGAFHCLPEKLQALFVQAHQSYLFNRFLSRRIKKGLPLNQAVVGDFVVGVERSGLTLPSYYKVVEDGNLSEINAQIKTGRLRVALPIFGKKQNLSHGEMRCIEENVLAQEGVKIDDLCVSKISSIGGKGGLRAALTPMREFKLLNVSEGREGSYVATVSFMLLRGSYATVFLREIIKPFDPIAAGF